MNPATTLPKRHRARLSFVSCATVTCCLVHGAPSHASSLRADVERVDRVWVQTALVVTHMRPRFLVSGEALALVLPEDGRDDQGCTTVGVVGARTTEFLLEHASSSGELRKGGGKEVEESDLHSTAGALTLVRCGASRQDFDGLTVRMKSPQGALEIVVAHGSKPAPSMEQVLPERTAGPEARPLRPGPPPPVAPLTDRVEALLRNVGESGGQAAEPLELRVDSEGNGRHRMVLAPGCHRLGVMPRLRAGGRVRVSDTDLEVRRAGSESVIRDRSFATDAVVDVCGGEPDLVELRVSGAPSGGSVVLVHGRWNIPQGIPEGWGPRARGAVTHALLFRRGPALEDPPVWEGVGVTGTTVIPMAVEPGACYVLAAGAAMGEVKAMQVAAKVGARHAVDNGGGGVEAGLVSFCTGSEGVVLVEIDAIGSRIAWRGGAWKVGTSPLGAEVLR